MKSLCAPIAFVLCAGCGDDLPPASAAEGTSSGPITTTTTSADSTGAGASESSDGSTTEGPVQTPACDSATYDWTPMVAGPSDEGFDAELEAVARRHDRLHVGITSVPTGLGTDVHVALDNAAGREAIEAFLAGEGTWDFEEATGTPLRDAVTRWSKATGAFAGVGVAADAYRYGVLRDQGYPCAEVEAARTQLVAAIDGLHLATSMTGEAGLVIRAVAHRDWPGDGESETTPVFDRDGNPQPLEKTNGTWREDRSSQHPELIWEDSCSRDQLIGWAAGFGAVWEVIANDPTFDDARKARLQADAKAIVDQLSTVRPSGYDLEIWDPEGRPSLHGYLHETNIEGNYGLLNGFHAAMAAGIVASLVYAAEDPTATAYLYDTLLGTRRLPRIAVLSTLIDFGAGTNYSNYNMGFDALWLTTRYIDSPDARAEMAEFALDFYASPNAPRQPVDNAQSFFDFVYAATVADASAFAVTPSDPPAAQLEQGLDTLGRFAIPPRYLETVENCDAAEIRAGVCTMNDGTTTELIIGVAHNDEIVAADPVPIDVRPATNFDWRSNPYRVNSEASGEVLPSSLDFRFAYWLGRWTRAPGG